MPKYGKFNVPLSNERLAQYNTERIVGGEHDGRLLSEMSLNFITCYADLETPDEVVLMPRTRDAAIYLYNERIGGTQECSNFEVVRNSMLTTASNRIAMSQNNLIRTVLEPEAKQPGHVKAQAVASGRLLVESDAADKWAATLRNHECQQCLRALEMLQRDPEYCTDILKAHADIMKL